MFQSNSEDRSVIAEPRRLGWLLMIVAIGANALLFYVLALARAKPSSVYLEEPEMMQVIPVDLLAPRVVEPVIEDQTVDVVQMVSEEMPAVSVQPTVDVGPSFMPRLSDWMGETSPDLPGLPVVLVGQPALRPTQPASVSGLGERLSILKVDRAPSRIEGAAPRYPHWAKRAGLEAVVTLRFIVTVEGTIERIKIRDIEGDERFGDEAARAVATWRFHPAIKAGKPVACWCFQKVSFKLTD